MNIEAMKQALEALQYPLNTSHEGFNVDMAELLAHRAIKALEEALTKQEQDEPVGKFAKFTDGIWREVADGSAGVPLYTTPPQRTWVGLTDEEIADCAEKMEASDPTDSFWREFFRGIEAKLKEKNT